MMSKLEDLTKTVKSVEKFCIDDPNQRSAYITRLNDTSISITREEIFNDKMGSTFITIWFLSPVSSDSPQQA